MTNTEKQAILGLVKKFERNASFLKPFRHLINMQTADQTYDNCARDLRQLLKSDNVGFCGDTEVSDKCKNCTPQCDKNGMVDRVRHGITPIKIGMR